MCAIFKNDIAKEVVSNSKTEVFECCSSLTISITPNASHAEIHSKK